MIDDSYNALCDALLSCPTSPKSECKMWYEDHTWRDICLPKKFFFIKHIGCAPFVCRPDQTPLNCWSVLLFSIFPSWQTARPTRNWAARTHRPVSSWSGSYRHPGLGHHTAHLASDYWAHWMWLERSSWDIVSYIYTYFQILIDYI